MSNCLKKKNKNKNNFLDFNKAEKSSLKRSFKVIPKDDLAILNVSMTINYMSCNALLDVFDFKNKRIERFISEVDKVREEWKTNKIKSTDLLDFCLAKGIDVYKVVKQLSFEQKSILAGKDFYSKKNRKTIPTMNFTKSVPAALESGFIASIIVNLYVLSKCFRFTKANLKEFVDKIVFYIDSYSSFQPTIEEYYMNDAIAIGAVKEDLGINIFEKIRIA